MHAIPESAVRVAASAFTCPLCGGSLTILVEGRVGRGESRRATDPRVATVVTCNRCEFAEELGEEAL